MKYYIDKRLVGQWEKFGIHPDEIDWVDGDTEFSNEEKKAVWDAIHKVILAYGKLYKRDMIQKSRVLRKEYKKGASLSDEQARISNRPVEIVDEVLANIEKTIKGLMGYNP